MLEQSLKEKDSSIDEIKIQVDNIMKENNKLLLDLEGSQNFKHYLSDEKTKTKDLEARVEELAGLILGRDENIETLKLEIKRNLENEDALKDDYNEKLTLQKQDIDTLKQEISSKVTTFMYTIFSKLQEKELSYTKHEVIGILK